MLKIFSPFKPLTIVTLFVDELGNMMGEVIAFQWDKSLLQNVTEREITRQSRYQWKTVCSTYHISWVQVNCRSYKPSPPCQMGRQMM